MLIFETKGEMRPFVVVLLKVAHCMVKGFLCRPCNKNYIITIRRCIYPKQISLQGHVSQLGRGILNYVWNVNQGKFSPMEVRLASVLRT